MVHCASRCRNSLKSSTCCSFSACAKSCGRCVLFIEFSHPQTPQNRTFPATIHHRVDKTPANFPFSPHGRQERSEAFLSDGMDQQEADDKHHSAGDAMNGERSR